MTDPAPVTPERLAKIADAVQAELPDHCGFVLVITPFSKSGDAKGPGAYASNGNRQDAVLTMMDVVQHFQNPNA